MNLVQAELSNIEKYDLKLPPILSRVRENIVDINDVLMDFHTINQDLLFDSNRLEFLDNRLKTINSLEQQFNLSSIQDILDKVNSMKLEVASVETISDQIKKHKSRALGRALSNAGLLLINMVF